MKYNKPIAILLLLLVTATIMWGLPALIRKLTYTPDDYPFVQYSEMLRELCIIEYSNKQEPMADRSGKRYTTRQFDSLMPLLNYRQLMSDGRLPDSIAGHAVTPPILRSRSVVFRYKPADIDTPATDLWLMYESMPKRVGMEMPTDLFRMKRDIEFIEAATNTVNVPKSELFRKAMDKQGYAFPSQWVSGDMNPRKPYDEGYFCLDADNRLFHMKMVNDRPFVKNTQVAGIDFSHFTMQEPGDRRFYGFLFSRQGEVYILEGGQGGYAPLKLDIPPLDLQRDEMTILGNMLYWTVSVTTPHGKDYYALECETLRKVDEYHVQRQPGRWDACSAWLFPACLTLRDPHSNYIAPALHFTGLRALIVNIALAFGLLLFIPNRPGRRAFNAAYVALTGLAGLLALVLLPGFSKRNEQ